MSLFSHITAGAADLGGRVAVAGKAAYDAATSAWAAANPTAAASAGLSIPAPWQERDGAILGNRE